MAMNPDTSSEAHEKQEVKLWTAITAMVTFSVGPAAAGRIITHATGMTFLHALILHLPEHIAPSLHNAFLGVVPVSTLLVSGVGLAASTVLPSVAYGTAETYFLYTTFSSNPIMTMTETMETAKKLNERTKLIRAAHDVAQEIVYVLGPACGPAVLGAVFDVPQELRFLSAWHLLLASIFLRVAWWTLKGLMNLAGRRHVTQGAIQL